MYRRAVRMAFICAVMLLVLCLVRFSFQYAVLSLWLLAPGMLLSRIARRVPRVILAGLPSAAEGRAISK